MAQIYIHSKAKPSPHLYPLWEWGTWRHKTWVEDLTILISGGRNHIYRVGKAVDATVVHLASPSEPDPLGCLGKADENSQEWAAWGSWRLHHDLRMVTSYCQFWAEKSELFHLWIPLLSPLILSILWYPGSLFYVEAGEDLRLKFKHRVAKVPRAVVASAWNAKIAKPQTSCFWWTKSLSIVQSSVPNS
jgi:hypothetical protein